MKIKLFLLAVLIFGSNFNLTFALSTVQEKDPIKVLFIGSSYFDVNYLPRIVEDIINASGRDVVIDQEVKSGYYLFDHARVSATEIKIKEQKWDYVILIGAPTTFGYPETFTTHPAFEGLESLCTKIRANCDSTKIINCMVWAFEDGMTWYENWLDTYEEMQAKIYTNTILYSYQLDIMIAPVGWAWRSVLIQKNYPVHYLHMPDMSHPELEGSILMALVIYSTMFQESSLEVPVNLGLSPEDDVLFRTVASDMVLNYLNLWNIKPNTVGISEISNNKKLQLLQNFPNPFQNQTQIIFSIPEPEYIEISLYDMLGNQKEVLLSEYKPAGQYSIQFNREGLASGIYFLTLKAYNQSIIKKLIIID